jgi:adenine-specific DNA-methyltransferase
MQKQIELGLVVFREDHRDPPFRKAHLRPVPDELDEESNEIDSEEDENLEVGLQVMGSVVYKQSQVAVKHLRKLMDGKVFNNPKDHEVLARLTRYVTEGDKDEIVLDFFAGSCATAEAVLMLNHEENANRQFIMVQIPEPTPEKSSAYDACYTTIADIGKERIRRVIAQMKAEREGQLPLETRETPEDLGFKVFKLAPSTFRQWAPFEGANAEALEQQLSYFDRGLEEGADPNHVIYEVILKEGYSLNACIEPLEIESNRVYRVTDVGRIDNPTYYICLDNAIHQATVDALPLDKETVFICPDTALDDSQKVNLSMQCLLKVL